MSRPRVLLALTVYNGGDVVAPALESVARLDGAVADVDVLLDALRRINSGGSALEHGPSADSSAQRHAPGA